MTPPSANAMLQRALQLLASADPRTVWDEVAGWETDATDAASKVAAHVAESWVLRTQGRIEEAREKGNKAVSIARQADRALPPDLIAHALLAVGQCLLQTQDLRSAEALARRAMIEAGSDKTVAAGSNLLLATVHRDRGVLHEAESFGRAALLADPGGGYAVHAASTLFEILRVRGKVEEGRRLLEQQLTLAPKEHGVDRARIGHWIACAALLGGDSETALRTLDAADADLGAVQGPVLAMCQNLRGEILREGGDLPGARHAYEVALRTLDRRAHSGAQTTIRLNLVLTCLLDGRPDEADELLDEERETPRPRAALIETLIELLSAAVAATKGDQQRWALHHQRAAARLDGNPAADRDHATALRLAGQAWSTSTDRTDRSRAFRARAMALAVWERAGAQREMAIETRALIGLGRIGVQVPAGPYDLVEEIGRGAWGEVWRAVHHVRGTEVAVKLLRTDATQDDIGRGSFDAEIRAVAALEHPGIVRILGHGVLGRTASMAGGRHHDGAPWFAMQLVPGGTLREVCGCLRWSQCRAVLSGLLDALAHAHARGVLHLDLKPANVLLERTDSGLRPKLADFGLAGLIAGIDKPMGTPQYMAPEQFRGDARDLRPATDLYAFGIVAWHLLTGLPPFPGDEPSQLRLAHLGSAAPEFRPRVQTPAGFETWLRRLLEKSHSDRFEYAADAAWALYRLADPDTDEPPVDLVGPRPEVADAPTFSLTSWDDMDSEELRTVDASGPYELPPMPSRWRSPAMPRPVGLQALELFGLSRVPLVGRARERNLLWATLADVHKRRKPRLVTIEGPPGSGRSALAQWLVEVAHERGLATVFSATFGALGRGLNEMLERWFHTTDASDQLTRSRVTSELPADLPPADVAVIIDVARGHARDAQEVALSCARLVTSVAAKRPVIVWFEGDAMTDAVASALAHELSCGEAPVLVLLEVSPGQDRDADRRYESLLDLSNVMPVTLSPPTPTEVRELVHALLPLDASATDAVVERAAGDLNLAVALLQDLVDRDAVSETEGVLVLRPGFRLTLPARLEVAWAQRLDRALDGLPPSARDALGACAIAGGEIPAEAWRGLCEALGVTSPSQLIRQLRTQRLVVPTAGRGWHFMQRATQAMLREQAVSDGRLSRISSLAAHHLPFPDPAQLGLALLDAGEPDGAMEPLRAGITRALARHDHQGVSALCDALEATLRTQGVDELRADWIAPTLARARLATWEGASANALIQAERALDLTVTNRRFADQVDAQRLLAEVHQHQGAPAEAHDSWKRAVGVAKDLGDPLLLADVRVDLAQSALARGDLEGAERIFERGADELGQAHDSEGLHAAFHMGRGLVLAERLAFEEAGRTLEQALPALEQAGRRADASACRAALGRLAAHAGRVVDAERWFAGAAAGLAHADARGRARIRLDAGLLDLARGDRAALRSRVESVYALGSVLPLQTRAWAQVLLLAADADSPDPTFQQSEDQLSQLLRSTAWCSADVARVLEAAALMCSSPARASRVWELAATQWRTLGNREAARLARERARAV